LGTSTWAWLDSVGQRLARLWMPWQGKSFSVEEPIGARLPSIGF
jgi:hypothetical protein